MSKGRQKFVKKPLYVYEVNQMEIKYKTLMNPDRDKYNEVKAAVSANQGYCPCKIEKTKDTKCMCLEFRNADKEGLCKCKLFTKVLRTEKEAEAYAKVDPKVQKEMDKREAKLMKEMKREEKLHPEKFDATSIEDVSTPDEGDDE